MDQCPASKDGKCTLKYAFGAWCDGYSTKCSMKESVEWYASIAANVADSIKRTFGIDPNGMR